MTNQEAFDIIWERARTMKYWAVNEMGCAYRGPNGPCLIGALIQDDEYKPEFERQWARDIAHNIPSLGGVSVDLLDEAQDAHDRVCATLLGWQIKPRDRELMLNRLRKAARKFGLRVPDAEEA